MYRNYAACAEGLEQNSRAVVVMVAMVMLVLVSVALAIVVQAWRSEAVQ